MVRIRRPAQLRLQLFGGGMEEDIYKQLKELEEQHVRAVRGLEKLAKALEHVREARTELGDLSEDANLNPTLSNLPEQLKVLKDALEEETWRTRGYITDVELEQSYLRKRLQGEEGPSS
jgi:chaperonin cofactor prefoldin